MTTFESMIGKTFKKASASRNEIIFVEESGVRHRFFHDQECCERVYIEDISGDLDDLVGAEMKMAEEITNRSGGGGEGLQQWTFYKFATKNGYVTIRWLGESNGYYGVDVSYEMLTNDKMSNWDSE